MPADVAIATRSMKHYARSYAQLQQGHPDRLLAGKHFATTPVSQPRECRRCAGQPGLRRRLHGFTKWWSGSARRRGLTAERVGGDRAFGFQVPAWGLDCWPIERARGPERDARKSMDSRTCHRPRVLRTGTWPSASTTGFESSSEIEDGNRFAVETGSSSGSRALTGAPSRGPNRHSRHGRSPLERQRPCSNWALESGDVREPSSGFVSRWRLVGDRRGCHSR